MINRLAELEDLEEQGLLVRLPANNKEIYIISSRWTECAELIQAISKAKRGKIDRDNMIEEIADVLICIEMLKQMYMISDEKINKWIEKKQAREVKRISQKELL